MHRHQKPNETGGSIGGLIRRAKIGDLIAQKCSSDMFDTSLWNQLQLVNMHVVLG